MTRWADDPFRAVRIEFLLPHEIRAAVSAVPVAYVPLGTYEWHCEHLPIGLDSLTAQGLCLRAASAGGGLVLPPLYYGTGGGHGAYPFTVMMETDAEIAGLLRKSLSRLSDFGFEVVVLFSGHFADPQIEMIKRLADNWNTSGSGMIVLAYAVNEIEGLPLAPDHAGLFETTLLGELWPDRVDLSRLPAAGGSEPADRHDPSHPIWGVMGADPRTYDAASAPALVAPSVAWLVANVNEALRRQDTTL
jgi:creatinine amidohydrolase